MVMDNPLKEQLVQVLEEVFLESCGFIQSKPYLSEKEISGDLYTRLSRHLKLHNLSDLLCRDNIERTHINSKSEITYVDSQNAKQDVTIERKADKSLVESMDKKLDLILQKISK